MPSHDDPIPISRFFVEMLGANLANVQWSWGAVDPLTNRVFLRVWEDEIKEVDGERRVLVLHGDPKGTSSGYPERKRHLELLRQGAQGIGVVCKAKFKSTGARQIADYDRETLVLLGSLHEDGGYVYATIDEDVSVDGLSRQQTGQSTITTDIRSILVDKHLDSTTKETLVNARVGQGKFRADVLKLWNGRCAVSGCYTADVVRASHIKPWRDSTNEERLDPRNGLALAATWDALFDAGLITFDHVGAVLISDRLPSSERRIFDLVGRSLASPPHPQTAAYLEYHQTHVFR